MKVDVCASIPSEQERKTLCEIIESVTGQGWSNFNGKVYATYIGEDEDVVWGLVKMFDTGYEHEIVLDRGYRS